MKLFLKLFFITLLTYKSSLGQNKTKTLDICLMSNIIEKKLTKKEIDKVLGMPIDSSLSHTWNELTNNHDIDKFSFNYTIESASREFIQIETHCLKSKTNPIISVELRVFGKSNNNIETNLKKCGYTFKREFSTPGMKAKESKTRELYLKGKYMCTVEIYNSEMYVLRFT